MNSDPNISQIEFMNSLKVGDSLETVINTCYGTRVEKHCVDRVSEKSVWISGKVYRKNKPSYDLPRPSSKERIDDAKSIIRHKKYSRALSEHDWRSESIETLVAVGEILKEAKAKRDAGQTNETRNSNVSA